MSLESQFLADLEKAMGLADKEYKIKFPKLRQLISERGVIQTAKILLNSRTTSEGFIKLLELGRLDLSIEHLASLPKYQPLFTAQEIKTALARLG